MGPIVKFALNQENGTLDRTSASVLHQKLYGTEINVFAIKICSVTIAYLVRLQGHGISQRTIVFAQYLKQFGLAQTVNVLPAFMEIIAFHVQLQGIGMQTKSNVFATTH
jgi:hypothetical protein